MATSPDHRDVTPGQPKSGAGLPGEARSSSGSWILLAVLALLGFVVLALVFLRKEPDERNAPTLTRLSLQPVSGEGTPVALDDLKGKVVFVNFWGTWCPPCVKEFPAIAAIQKQYGERADFRVLAVSCGTATDDETKIAGLRKNTQAFLDQWSARYVEYVDFRAHLDLDQATRRAVREVTEWPTGAGTGDLVYPFTLLLDRKHRIRFKWVGPASQEQFTEQIEKVLNE